MSLTAVWLVDGLPPSGARNVSAIEKLLSDHGPVLATVVRKIVDRDPVGARGSVVRSNFLPGSFEIGRIDNLLH